MSALLPLSIPSPSDGVWNLGPLPLRGYALAIILGIVVAIWLSERRWVARGGRAGDMQDLAIWGVPFGIVGARIYHVATDSSLYFGEGRNPWDALALWRGGLGVWGAVALGALGVYLGARRKGIRLLPVLDTMAPTVLVAQALGRWGNWFNQELYGRPTTLPWGLEIDADHFPAGSTFPTGTTFHPTFLYEFVWNLLGFAVLVALDRRYRLGRGRMAALYVLVYTAGRGWIESLRIDTVELSDVAGLRFNVWTSIVLFLLAAAYLLLSRRLGAGREESVYLPGREPVEAVPEDVPDEPGTSVGNEAPHVGPPVGPHPGPEAGPDPGPTGR
ncbi:MAG: prolipoprotein diacylglyceryl transferase [Nocardioides sp.]|nr:prolipoprotein diacylglyceryl transferase [Nocardioides sp.]